MNLARLLQLCFYSLCTHYSSDSTGRLAVRETVHDKMTASA